jgi:hypothetical protein
MKTETNKPDILCGEGCFGAFVVVWVFLVVTPVTEVMSPQYGRLHDYSDMCALNSR